MVSKRAKQDIRMKGIYNPKGVSINGSKTVSVFGLGFVGLTTALGFAEIGCRVFGIDIDEERKKSLRNGVVPFHEPHMDGILNNH